MGTDVEAEQKKVVFRSLKLKQPLAEMLLFFPCVEKFRAI